MKRVTDAANEIAGIPLTLDDSPARSISDVSAIARRMKRKEGLSLIVLDYLQLVAPEDRRQPREQQVALCSRQLKALARELNIPVIVLAQLNRQTEAGTDNTPRLSHLRESGAIEQDADVVAFVHRPAYYATKEADRRALAYNAELLVRKQRNGATGTVELTWNPELVSFAEPKPNGL
jgi:replicative DNA helicase